MAVNVWVMPWWIDRGQTGNKFCSFCLPGKESLALSSSSLPFHEDDYWWYPNKQHPLLPCSNIFRHTCHSICSVSSVCCSDSNVKSFWGGVTSIFVGIFCIVWTFSPKGKCVHFRCYGTVWQFCHNVMHQRMLRSVNNSRKRRTQLPCNTERYTCKEFSLFCKVPTPNHQKVHWWKQVELSKHLKGQLGLPVSDEKCVFVINRVERRRRKARRWEQNCVSLVKSRSRTAKWFTCQINHVLYSLNLDPCLYVYLAEKDL